MAYLKNLGLVALLVGMTGLLGAGSCHYHGHRDDDDDDCFNFDDDDDDGWFHDDDDDGFCDDDDDGFHTNYDGGGGHPYRLDQYEMVASTDEARHPIAELNKIRGLSLRKALGPREYGKLEFKFFTEQVLMENEDLLALPGGTGRLVFESFDQADGKFFVLYLQSIQGPGGAHEILEDAEMEFVFDGFGDLMRIRNSTRILTE